MEVIGREHLFALPACLPTGCGCCSWYALPHVGVVLPFVLLFCWAALLLTELTDNYVYAS